MINTIAITAAEIISPLGIGLDNFIGNLTSINKKYQEPADFDNTITNILQKNLSLNSFESNLSKYLLLTSVLLRKKINKPLNNIIVGSALSSLSSIYTFEKMAQNKGYYGINPGTFPDTVLNVPACRIALLEKKLTLAETISAGLCSGLDAIGMGCCYLNNNPSLHEIICGGGDEYNKELKYIFNTNHGFYGFDKGAALFQLKRLKTARQEKTTILAEIVGYRTNQNNDINKNIEENIRNILAKSKIIKSDIDLILTNKNKLNKKIDTAEEKAIEKIFGKEQPRLAVKKYTKECLGLSGPIQIIIASLFFQNQKFNLFNLKKKKNNIILINNINPDGRISTIILKKHGK
jgi:3-oxoacyl-(acyl-carrier-protein) synthase